jgi:Protein of unknown function (DUF2985)
MGVGMDTGTSAQEQGKATTPSHQQRQDVRPGADAPAPGVDSKLSPVSGRLRSLSNSFEQSALPEGFSAATGNFASTIFASRPSGSPKPAGAAIKAPATQESQESTSSRADTDRTHTSITQFTEEPAAAAPFPNGYHFPPRRNFWQSTKLGLAAFWEYFTTPLGFIVTIYGLNIVAWGGMLFLLLCNAGTVHSPLCIVPLLIDLASPGHVLPDL